MINVFYCESVPRHFKHVFNAALYYRFMEICEDVERIFRTMDFRIAARMLLKHVYYANFSIMM